MPKKKATVQPGETEQELIARLKREFLAFYAELPVKQAAADFIGRSVDAVEVWIKNDPAFSAAYSKAKAEWSRKQQRRVKPDNLLANLYPEGFKPPKQEVEQNLTTAITINHVHPGDNDPTNQEAG